MSLNIKTLGQVFTPDTIVNKMFSLIKNDGKILEPSCGDGAFFYPLKIGGANIVGIEIDNTICPENVLCMDFFDYSVSNKFDTIIGNPPYVRFQDIDESTKNKQYIQNLLDNKVFDKRSNLYLFFIYKSVEHLNDGGELIFVVPRDFLHSTSAANLNNFMYSAGTITDIIDLGDAPVFDGACPNCVIFRFEKGNFTHKTTDNKNYSVINGQTYLTKENYTVPFSKLFFVKVGAVSGANSIFENENGNVEFVCSETAKTGKTVRAFYNIKAPELFPYKEQLLQRRVKHFTEDNWYMYGRNYYVSEKPRIYVNMKTRNVAPFFCNDCNAYDGSILAIFPKFKTNNIDEIKKDLNAVDWYDLGFVCDGRYLFSQRSLETTVLPSFFEKYCF